MSIHDMNNEIIEYTTENCNNFIELHKKLKNISNLLKKKYIKSIDFNIKVIFRNEEWR